jgi:cardiolipin synthase
VLTTSSGRTLLLLLHTAIAVSVSLHVLLTKRDVGAAIGWIGLGWLSPFIGGGLYFLLGINRVHRRARRLRESVPHQATSDPRASAPSPEDDWLVPLERAAHRIARRPALAGNTVEPLHNGDEAYPRMLAAIDGARRSVGLCSYILRDDAAGRPFLDALIRAHGRGVAVRVLVDGIGSGYFRSPAYQYLRQHGIAAARFLHSRKPWQMAFLNLRTHKKLLIVDGHTAFAGGLNIGAENLVASHPRHPVHDMHFAIGGPVVTQLAEAFAQDWAFTTNEVLGGEDWFPNPTDAGSCTARVVTSGPDRELERIEMLALMAVTCARRTVRIMTPYFLPDERIVTALALAALRGVKIDVIVPERSNKRYVDWASRANIEPLLQAGCRIWRNPPPFEHSKLMVVDSLWTLIGSANWDTRSFRLNFELDLEVTHAPLAQTLEDHMLSKRSSRITLADLSRRSLPARLRDAALRLMLPYL